MKRGKKSLRREGGIVLLKRGDKVVLRSISFILMLFILIILTSFVSAASNVTQADAENCINQSVQIMAQMSSEGLNIIRVNDTLREAALLYDSQVLLLNKKSQYDFSVVIPYCTEIASIHDSSVVARDEFSALIIFYNESIVPGMNTSSIDPIISNIKDEIKNERYENVKPLVDKAYTEIINVKSSYTALNLFVSTTTLSLKKFFIKNWITMGIIILVFIALFFFYRIKIMKWIVSRKMQNLELRKSTIKELIMKTQKAYFETGQMAENEYNIKTKKFAELIRDIDRQLPLLKEELVKIERVKVKRI